MISHASILEDRSKTSSSRHIEKMHAFPYVGFTSSGNILEVYYFGDSQNICTKPESSIQLHRKSVNKSLQISLNMATARISDEVESFDLLSGVHCCLEQIEVCLMDIRRTSVVMNPLSLKFCTTADNFITNVSVLVADDSVF